MYLFTGKILKNQRLTADIRYLRISAPADFCQQSAPGRFIMLSCNDGLFDPLLKRPFGILNRGENWFEVVIKEVGKGSLQLGEMKEGSLVSGHGPLGNGYPKINSDPDKDNFTPLILVAGGMGIASIASCLLFSSKAGIKANSRVLLYGAANRDELLLLDEIKESAPGIRIETITDDGSSGRQGWVTELLETELQQYPEALVFACGPEPMLINVQQVLRKFSTRGYLSLENRMACGFGVCLGCVQDVAGIDDNRTVESAKVCTQGPVFPADKVIF